MIEKIIMFKFKRLYQASNLELHTYVLLAFNNIKKVIQINT